MKYKNPNYSSQKRDILTKKSRQSCIKKIFCLEMKNTIIKKILK